jgi:lipopolysaccharide transport system ATP-binding protein
MSDVIISVEGLGKKYRISHQGERQRYVALRDVIAEKAKQGIQKLKFGKQKTEIKTAEGQNQLPLSTFPISALPASEDFWALHDVSFEVKRGEGGGLLAATGRARARC